MHELITLYKPSGQPVKVNESSLDAAIKLGWLEKDPTVKPVKPVVKPVQKPQVKSKSRSKK